MTLIKMQEKSPFFQKAGEGEGEMEKENKIRQKYATCARLGKSIDMLETC